jgi:hypothetical protein
MAQKLRKEVTEKERDEHFNAIRPMIPMKQKWRVKEKNSTPILTTFDDDMDLLDDDESPLIKDDSLPPNDMDINMVFMLPAEFMGVEVQCNYSVILERDWIHVNHCVPSTLHPFWIQWIKDEIKMVHADTSNYVALADIVVDWQYGSVWGLLGKDFLGYDFLSISTDGFVPVSVQPTSKAQLSNIVSNEYTRECRVVTASH